MATVSDLRPVVLLVEDTPFWHALVTDTLADLDCRVRVAEDGVGAMAALDTEGTICCAILDICLPGPMSGLDLLQLLRSAERTQFARLPVAMLTTSPSGLDVAKARMLGADRYICKTAYLDGLPWLCTAIRSFVTTALEKRNATLQH